MSNIIAIVGRPNVGKSTLFNRLTNSRDAIMHDDSGITRDRHYGFGEWQGKNFTVIDTGGYVRNSDDIFEEAIRDQVELALDEANIILFMVDLQTGLTGLDQEFADTLRQTDKPVYVVVNKADNPTQAHLASEFYALGFGELFPLSSATGTGTGELLDEIHPHLEADAPEDPYEGIPKLAIVGRPNVGKSSFINALIGKERSIVTDVAGTTRDALNVRYQLFGKDFVLVDTAGIRRKKKVHENVEFYSVMRSIRALEESDVVVVMLDATQGLESQDLNLIRLADRQRKGIVILVNKWDLVPKKDSNTTKEWMKEMQEKLGANTFIPIIFISVLEKQRIFKAIEKAIEIFDEKTKKIPTSKLNDALLPEIERYPPPAVKGKYIRIKYISQLPTKSPTFAFFCNHPQYLRAPYIRFLENKLRSHFGFEGVPIKAVFRKK